MTPATAVLLIGSSGAASGLRRVDGANRRTAVAGVISELQITMRKKRSVWSVERGDASYGEGGPLYGRSDDRLRWPKNMLEIVWCPGRTLPPPCSEYCSVLLRKRHVGSGGSYDS